MKKIIFAIIVILLTAATVGYTQIFENKETGNGVFSNRINNSETNSDFSGLFKNEADAPGGRPENGSGIGQEQAPLKDGLSVLISYSVALIAMKIYKAKKK